MTWDHPEIPRRLGSWMDWETPWVLINISFTRGNLHRYTVWENESSGDRGRTMGRGGYATRRFDTPEEAVAYALKRKAIHEAGSRTARINLTMAVRRRLEERS